MKTDHEIRVMIPEGAELIGVRNEENEVIIIYRTHKKQVGFIQHLEDYVYVNEE